MLKKAVTMFTLRSLMKRNGSGKEVERFYVLRLWINSLSMTIQMKATERYFLAVVLKKVVLT